MAGRTPLVGAHVDAESPLEAAWELGLDCVQIFLWDPNDWKRPPPREDADELRGSAVPVYVHSTNVMNLAAKPLNIRHASRKTLREQCEDAAGIGAAALVVHGGYAKDDDVDNGIMRWRKALEELEAKAERRVKVLIENTAGGQNAPARHFDTLARLWDAVGGFDVGFCFDTCHAHAAGEELSGAVERVLRIVGRIDLVHANDSSGEPGSGRDRHANIGSGNIPVDVLRDMVRAARAPVIVETPEGGLADDLAFVRAALSG